MNISIFELFSIGIGPSSSHTVGPMCAANAFISLCRKQDLLSKITRLQIATYGSLALTGDGHGTKPAILMGLEGHHPETVPTQLVNERAREINTHQKLKLDNQYEIEFILKRDYLEYRDQLLPKHTNGMQFSAYAHEQQLISEIYYSVGGGFIVTDAEYGIEQSTVTVTYPFKTADDLFSTCRQNKLTIAELMASNELAWHSDALIKHKILQIAELMKSCIHQGCHQTGTLPGILKVRRRAPELYHKLKAMGKPSPDKQADMMNWLNLYAIAVNEENAAGGRVVTAPTNGAAGIIPSVLTYYLNYHRNASEAKIMDFLLTAGAIGLLYKTNASISGAEVGCQGEVGVASSMAAAALAAVLNGTLAQIENAAEIAMEHHLGMTCDPVNGLVQIPCIERNAMGAVKAVNAARLALMEDGRNVVSLDKVIATMRQTGHDMMSIYKETSLGGLAVNVTEC